MEEAPHVVVVGAGVIGLQSALTLRAAGYAITIVAAEWPDAEGMTSQAWASPWAGAQWRPHAPAGTLAAAWEARTYRHFEACVAREVAAGHDPGMGPSSLAAHSFTHYWHASTVPAPLPLWWSSLSPTFRVIPTADLPAGVAYGATIRSFVLQPALYLAHLHATALAQGVRTLRLRLPLVDDLRGALSAARQHLGASTRIDAWVNATGGGAAAMVPDPKMGPNRGQTIVVRGEAEAMRTLVAPEGVLAVMPRKGSGTTVIGATRGPGRGDRLPVKAETEWLVAGAQRFAPELGEVQILAEQVGFRPRREGGARVEVERVEGESGAPAEVVVHAYGHEGAGYQQSVGVAETVLELMKGALGGERRRGESKL